MYRKNRYGENVEVNRGECGSCKNYVFENENYENECLHHYKQYFMYNNSCRHWEEADDIQGDAGCFLTTACCKYKGLPDDCYELEMLRRFRDNVLLINEEGKKLVKEYYHIAPGLVEKIEALPEEESKDILENIYNKVLRVIDKIKANDNEGAIARYYSMVCWVESVVS